MSQAGYTLTEMLVAMMFAALALGGLGSAGQLLGQAETRLATSRALSGDLRRLDAEFQSTFEQADWFAADDRAPAGDAEHFSVACGLAARCGLELLRAPAFTRVRIWRGDSERTLHLRGTTRPRLSYVGMANSAAAETAPADGALRAIILADGPRRLAIYRVVAEQSANCTFDARTGSCLLTDGAR